MQIDVGVLACMSECNRLTRRGKAFRSTQESGAFRSTTIDLTIELFAIVGVTSKVSHETNIHCLACMKGVGGRQPHITRELSVYSLRQDCLLPEDGLINKVAFFHRLSNS